MMQQYRRTNFLTNKKFQLKFAFFVCSWIFVLSMIYPIIIYNIFELFLKHIGEPVPQLSPERIKDLESQVLIVLGALQLIFLGITFILTIFLSHRIAGPLFKLKRAMDDVAKGKLDQRIQFRKNDHFLELADTFNDMVQSLSVRRESK